MASDTKPAVRAQRPVLKHSSMSGGSFIQDHQQYRPPHANSGIDDTVEHAFKSIKLSNDGTHSAHPSGLGKSESQTRLVRESGVVHSISHRNCQPGPEDDKKLVATLFYKSQSPRHPHFHPDSSNYSDPTQIPQHPPLVPGEAPTMNMASYPLEPPAPEPEPLDHLYGQYISQICLTHFLQILDSLQNPWRRITSSHRCLDSQVHPQVMEITFSPGPNPEYISFGELRRHESIWRFEREWNVEVVIQKESVWRRYKRLAVFDMDSTLIHEEVIDEMARVLGVQDKVSAITSRAMNGELDFAASLQERVALLKGAPISILEDLKSVITIRTGAKELCKALKRLGYKLAVLSGGFLPLTSWLAGELGIDYAYANTLAVSDDKTTLTGELEGPIIDGARKAALVKEIAAKEGIPLNATIAIGDGANDLPMINLAGLGVAVHAKPAVQLQAPSRINTGSLLDVLYLLGFNKEEQEEILSA